MDDGDAPGLEVPSGPAGERLRLVLELERRGVPEPEISRLEEALAPPTKSALEHLVQSFRRRSATLGWFSVERVTAAFPTRVAAVLVGDRGARVHVAAVVEPEPPHRLVAIMHTDVPEPVPAVEEKVRSGDALVAVRDYGGEGPPIVLLHGGGGSSLDWDPLIPHLRDFRVVAFDLRGHGQTTGPPFSFTGTADDVSAVVTELELDRPVLVGHSLGGVASVNAAVSTTTARLVVNVDGHLGSRREFLATGELPAESPEESAAEAEAWAWEGAAVELEDLLREQLVVGHPREAAVRRRYVSTGDGRLRIRPSPEEAAAVTQELLEAPIEEWHRRCPVPLLAVMATGEQGPGVNPELLNLAKRAPADRLALLPHITVESVECGHRVAAEAPARLAELLLSATESANTH